MSDRRGTHEEDDFLDAPERGSADELLDAGAHSELDAMRHSTAHVMAEAVMDLFPGTKLGIGPAIDDGFYYDFDLPRPLTPDDLAAIEARMAASVAADHPFVRHELPPAEGRAFFVERGQPYKVEILDDLAARSAATGEPMPPTSTYEHGPFIDLCKGPHVASTGRIGPFKLLSVAGAYWRGDEKRPMLQRIYGTVWATQEELDQLPVASGRGEEARPSPARRPARPVQLPRRQPGLGVLASQGPAHLADARGRDARAPGPPRLPGGLDADPGQPPTVGAVGPLGPLPRQHVHPRHRGSGLLAQADELPREHVHLPCPDALLPGPAAAPVRVRPAPSQRAERRAPRADPGPPVHPGRRPHLRPTGPAGRRDRGAPRRWSRSRTAGSGSSRAIRSPRSRTGRSATRALGASRRRSSGRPSTRPACATRSSPRTGRSTRRRSTSTSTTRSAGSGRWPPSRPT